MKKLSLYFLIPLLSVFLFACQGGKSNNDNNQQDSTAVAKKPVLKHFYAYDMSKFGYQLTVMVPDSTVGVLQAKHDENGAVEIKVGKSFGISVSIGDAGDLSLLKSDLKGDLVFKSTILKSDSNSILYKKVIPNTNIQPQFHFLYNIKLGNDYYDVKSLQMNTYGKHAAQKMLDAAHTLALKNDKSPT